MATEKFTRDEVILALDVLHSSDTGRVVPESDAIKELSLLLNRLPIHPMENRRANFRNATGIARQIMLYRSSCRRGKKDPNVGGLFFDIGYEFKDRMDELHSIAEAIRRNEKSFDSRFGSPLEDKGFPEGILLGHLHCLIEQRDGSKIPTKEYCEVCNSIPSICYQKGEWLLENHLIVPLVKLDFTRKYQADSFLTVCPTCHAALHRFRPWLTRDNCGDVLR